MEVYFQGYTVPLKYLFSILFQIEQQGLVALSCNALIP